MAECIDCGLPYGSPAFPDLLVPDWAWQKMVPDSIGGGLLCPSCMCARAEKAGVRCKAVFKSGPFGDQDEPEARDDAIPAGVITWARYHGSRELNPPHSYGFDLDTGDIANWILGELRRKEKP